MNIKYKEEGDFAQGALILIDKPLNWTSFDVVNKIRWCLKRNYGKLKVGHAGTLDPLATGVVIVCTGIWTKDIESYMAQDKEYIAELTFGATTPSYDLETEPENFCDYTHITKEILEQTLTKFIGNIKQRPPIFSAIRVNGDRAYKSARKGEEIEMPLRDVTINNIEILDFNPPIANIKINCSKGTYIRSLAHDIGQECGSGAYLSALQRTKSGDFKIEDANNMEKFVAFLQNS